MRRTIKRGNHHGEEVLHLQALRQHHCQGQGHGRSRHLLRRADERDRSQHHRCCRGKARPRLDGGKRHRPCEGRLRGASHAAGALHRMGISPDQAGQSA